MLSNLTWCDGWIVTPCNDVFLIKISPQNFSIPAGNFKLCFDKNAKPKQKFRQTSTVDALQYNGCNIREVERFCKLKCCKNIFGGLILYTSKNCTHNECEVMDNGDWIVRYNDGKLGLYSSEVFKNKFERVKE